MIILKEQINILFEYNKTVKNGDMNKQQETKSQFKGRERRAQTTICISAVSLSNSTQKKQVSSPGGRLSNCLMVNPPEDALSV